MQLRDLQSIHACEDTECNILVNSHLNLYLYCLFINIYDLYAYMCVCVRVGLR
jgi:hypothetical protein